MSKVKVFFKTIFWTLVVLIVLLGGFWAYMRFFNHDLAKSFAGIIYQSDAVECPVCETCEVCTVSDEGTTGDVNQVVLGEVDFSTEFNNIDKRFDEVLDAIDELDNIKENDEYGVVEPPQVDDTRTKDEIIKDLEQRIKKLESRS